ncbi:MAG: twin-arginine translocase TatA/TatE family subunit [Methyloceanibacter sp.]|uniref:twin-arginine translocase TatA/TatE family subunit n=1 Tax=Methyloceanibacter sp. TaxID=1965321 RepID=UPI003D9ABC9C
MGIASWWHILLVIVLFVLLFGRGKISELMGDVAQGIKSFKKGMADQDEPAPASPRAKPKLIEHEAAKAPPAAKPAARAKTTRAKTTQAKTTRRKSS